LWNRFHFRQKENTQKTHAEEKLDKNGVMLGIFQKKKKNWENWCYIGDISNEIVSTRQQMGFIYILVTDVKSEYKRTRKVNMYEVCKETSDYGESLIKMSVLQGLDLCFSVDQCGWLIEGFVMK